MADERAQLRDAMARRPSGPAPAVLERADAAAGDAARVAASDETTALARRARSGDASAREALIDRLLPLIGAVARDYRTEGLDRTDLVQEGIVGLLRALERYDPDLGVPFVAFATWWVRRALQDARSDFVRPFRLPPKALRQLSQLKSEHQRIYQAEHRSADVAELADLVHLDRAQAEALAVADARVRSLDEPVVVGDAVIGSLGDLVEDPLSAEAFEEVLDAVAGEQLRSLLSRLTEREREVVSARFGFEGASERLVDIGERLGVSAERVRQIEERALAKLRHSA